MCRSVGIVSKSRQVRVDVACVVESLSSASGVVGW